MGFGSFSLGARGVLILGVLATAIISVSPNTMAFAVSPLQNSTVSSSSTTRLQNAVRRLNTSLADYSDAENWRRILQLNILETLSAQGEQADVILLRQIHDRFTSEAKETGDPAFEDVRNALQDQIDLLEASQVGDLFVELVNARGQFHPITIEEMTAQRDQARDELLLLKEYYRKTMTSRDRANLFYDLKLNDAIEFLDTVKFELAPEVSVGKIESLIRDVQKKLDDVILKIDAIPLPVEPDNSKPNTDPAKTDDNPAQDDKLRADSQEPDENQKALTELKQEKSELQDQIQKLNDQRTEIRKSDTPRRNERNQTFNALRTFELNFAELGNERGDPYFVSAASTFERFVRTYYYGTSDYLEEEFLSRLATLESELLGIDGPDQREIAAKLGSSLQWMENANQIPQLVTAIRARHSFPNVYFSISSNFLNQIGSQTVTDAQRVRENFGGRLIRGIARTNGQVSVQLRDDPHQIHASIQLAGTVGSSTYVQEGKTQVFANTTGQIAAQRSVFANIGGLFADDADVSATFCSNFGGTNSGLKIVNRIAQKKFNEAKGAGERATARNAKDQLSQSFTERTDEPLEKGREKLAELLDRLTSDSQYVPEVYVRSFSSEIMGVAKKSSISALAAQDLPGPSYVPTDVSIRLHDSTLSIYLDKTFAGKTYTDKELAEEIGRITGNEPVSLTEESGQEDQSFSISFATVRPVQFEFADSRFSIVVSGRRFAQGDKRINEGLKIILRFKIKQIDGKLKLVRDGEAEVDYLNPELKRPVTVAFRSFLLGRLNPKEGAQEMVVDLPDNLLPIEDVEALKDSPVAKQLGLVQCRSENGWLYIGWNYRPENTNPIWQVDLPAIWNETVQYDSAPPVPPETEPSVNPVPAPAATDQPPTVELVPAPQPDTDSASETDASAK